MIAADSLDRRLAKLAVVDVAGRTQHRPHVALAALFSADDPVIANDPATLPASLRGTHCQSGKGIEIRLAAWISARDPTRFVAVAFGAGDHSTRTEDRLAPPPLSADDRLVFGPLVARVERLLEHPRLLALRFAGDHAAVLAGLARHGRPIQYAHIPEPLAVGDVWTKIAATPTPFETPSAGFALDWRTLDAWWRRGIHFTTLTHAAGISSTGDPVLDLRLPFDEPYHIPEGTAAAIARTKSRGKLIVAVGTRVVRAVECAANADGSIHAGSGVAVGRITRETKLRVVDAILTGVHAPAESHFELLRAFAGASAFLSVFTVLAQNGYRTHEFGDSVLIERQAVEDLPRCPGSAAR